MMLTRILLVGIIASLAASVLLPLILLFRKAFEDQDGRFAGITHFIQYFSTPALSESIFNTLFVSFTTTLISVSLAFLFAYAMKRTMIKGKTFFQQVALLPLFAPTMMHGIALTYLFGNQGMVTTGLFGLLPSGFTIELYGPIGIIMAEVIYTFPQAYLILAVSFMMADYNLYEAAKVLGASRLRTFLTVTIPNVKYGLISALFVCFTLSFTDFGAPKVVGGQFNVLATDIYKQVIGQQNMTMGAVVGLLLTIPAILAFIVDRLIERKQSSTITAKSKPYQITPSRGRDLFYFVFCSGISLAILFLIGSVLFAALVKVWPYDLTLTLNHFDFSQVAGDGTEPLVNSILVALITAVIGTVVTFVSAYLIEKMNVMKGMRQIAYFLSILPLALPGLVIGLSYVFFFNKPGNPLNILYGTIWILVLANIVHFFSVSFITATSALKRLDKEVEMVSQSLGVPLYKTFFRVTVPMSLPAILEIAVYYFINSMVTISAVVFLYAPDLKLASVAIVNMDDAGDIAPAAAMSILIVAINLTVRGLFELSTRVVRKRLEVWQKPST
ncbi:putative 2-aminoethylphosphonate ABC transporter permease subunit [Brevibacillus sp. SYSU BS000544]|uniref:putative 2-aminoethylphosphonate ABC transporter permease subunit n=1 Tax=Brevibacillus sp. SYSU BS000544 TaxID=3416443 RepID=UPI003CE50D2E